MQIEEPCKYTLTFSHYIVPGVLKLTKMNAQ